MELLHEWAITLIQFQAGEKVQTPAFIEETNGKPETVKATSASDIAAFFGEHIK